MEGKPSATKFIHGSLPDPVTYIRLLQIQGVDSGGRVLCLLTAWPVAEAPAYYALSYVIRKHTSSKVTCFILIDYHLSYTWGSPTPSCQIFINRRVFAVGQNCVEALKQAHGFKAHASKATWYFWMDALCIDQSTTLEKSQQVGMMTQIYERAVHVLACVGPATDNSSSLFQLIDDNSELLTKIYASTLRASSGDMLDWVVPDLISTSTWSALRPLFPTDPQKRESLARTFIAFMNRPYFSRVWVLQELHLASSLSLCCGMAVRSFEHLLAVSVLIDHWTNTSMCEYPLCNSTPAVAHFCYRQPWILRRQKDCQTLQEGFRDIKPQRGCLTLASGHGGRRRLASVLGAMQKFQCTDIRDKLFGVLALIEWGSSRPLVPDYGKDNYQVAIEVLRLYLEHPESAPSGTAPEWPCQLWETFNVKTIGEAMSTSVARILGSAYDPSVHYFESWYKKPHMEKMNQPYLEKPRRSSDHQRDVWYGLQLEDTVGTERRSPSSHRPLHYFCSDGNCQRDCYDEQGKIIDQNERFFAHAPSNARPGDWLLISKAAFVSAMLVVRIEDAIQGRYRIIGPVYRDCGPEEVTLPLFGWQYFESCWDAEDLFFFDWMRISRSALSFQWDPWGYRTEWIRRSFYSSTVLSYFCGPIE